MISLKSTDTLWHCYFNLWKGVNVPVGTSRRLRWVDRVQRAWPWSFCFMFWLSAWRMQRFEYIDSHRGPERPRAYRLKWIPIYGYISSFETWTVLLHSESRAWGVGLLRKPNYRWEAGLVDLKGRHKLWTISALKLNKSSELPSSPTHYFSFLKRDGQKSRLFPGQSRKKHSINQHLFFVI